MKIVILGAGASYDCMHEFYDGHVESYRPPLGNELFDKRISFRDVLNQYKGAQALASELAAGGDVEAKLEEIKTLVDRSNDLVLRSQFIDIQFYLQDLFFQVSLSYKDVGLSNYDVLLQWANRYSIATREDVCFITFNYDTLLEYAFEKVVLSSAKITSIDDYINYRIKIIKPHGSWNWVKKLINLMTPLNTSNFHINVQLFENPNLLKSARHIGHLDEQITISPHNALMRDIELQNKNCFFHYLPQIAVPLVSKTDFLIPKEHNIILENSLQNATDILIIGWKGGEKKFLELLKRLIGQRLINITIVDPRKNILLNNLQNYINTQQVKNFDMNWPLQGNPIHYSGFSSYIKHLSDIKEMQKNNLKFNDFFEYNSFRSA